VASAYHRPDVRDLAVVLVTAALIVGVLGSLIADVGRPYPGFFFSPDYRLTPVEPAARAAGLRVGDRIVAVDGASPLTLLDRVAAAGGPLRYELARDGRPFTVTLPPAVFTWRTLVGRFATYFVASAVMLGAGVLVYAQNPPARPNRNFLIYMCLWALSNVVTPEAFFGLGKRSVMLIGFLPAVLSVHGWVFFLTYPVNPARQAWLDRRRLIPRLYVGAVAFGLVAALTFTLVYRFAPSAFLDRWFYRAGVASSIALALVSFPVKVLALLDTRRRAASPLVNHQITVLMLGIGLGLGFYLLLMLLPLTYLYPPPVDPQWGAALVLLYPAAIAYATVRYRLFDASVVIRRSVVYTALAGLITATYALALAAVNALLTRGEITRSPWFSGALMFVVALAFYPVRERLRRAVDRTFFRERYDHVRTIQTLARSMTSLLDLEEITRRLRSTIESSMHAREVRLRVGPPAPEVTEVLAAAPGAVTRYQVAADPTFALVAPAALAAWTELAAEVVVPLRFGDDVRGLLLLGAKRSDVPYTSDDLVLLETVADQTAVAVVNAEAHQKVVEYAHDLERSLLIRTNLAKFVPQRVRQLIEASPEAPSLDKRETDVSVLFADITGYTRLSSRLAPDQLDELVERYFGAFLDEIVKYGGDVNETAGDGLMVIFHEGDHPRAAVAAAAAIHRRAAELNAELAGRFEPLAMHIGINTGPASLGATKIEGRAGTRWTYTASGMTTNLAARLAAVAQGGEIIISESTRARLGAGPDCADLGERMLKNVDQPVRIFRV
jgi:class 3 adenylate cyclase